MKQHLFTFALFCLVCVISAAPTNNGYQYKVQLQNNHAVLPQNKPQGGKQNFGYEIIKLDCDTKGPTIKESNGQIVTITYYDCGEKGKKLPKVSGNPGYLPRKNLSV